MNEHRHMCTLVKARLWSTARSCVLGWSKPRPLALLKKITLRREIAVLKAVIFEACLPRMTCRVGLTGWLIMHTTLRCQGLQLTSTGYLEALLSASFTEPRQMIYMPQGGDCSPYRLLEIKEN
eukprot:1157161-Pelagomonas_calceolata.AAC.22